MRSDGSPKQPKVGVTKLELNSSFLETNWLEFQALAHHFLSQGTENAIEPSLGDGKDK